MSYLTIKTGIEENMGALGYAPSTYSNVESIPTVEYGNTFMLSRISGENDENTSETLSALVYDIQKWEIQILFPRSGENQSNEDDAINIAVDAIIKRLDNPANWVDYARIQKYKTWNIQTLPNYYLLTMELKIIDTVIY